MSGGRGECSGAKDKVYDKLGQVQLKEIKAPVQGPIGCHQNY